MVNDEYNILPLPPQAVKLTADGLFTWNQYAGDLRFTAPVAEPEHVFAVIATTDGQRIYLLDHPQGYDLYLRAALCIPLEYNATTMEWVEVQ